MSEHSDSRIGMARAFRAFHRGAGRHLAPLALVVGAILLGPPASAQIDPFSKVGFEPTDVAHQLGNDTINPLTGLLVRNETIMGPFTAPHGYQYSIVAHYSPTQWHMYSKQEYEDSNCVWHELHKPDCPGNLGMGWNITLGQIHVLNGLVRYYSYESPIGELTYFYRVSLNSPFYLSTDGKSRLEERRNDETNHLIALVMKTNDGTESWFGDRFEDSSEVDYTGQVRVSYQLTTLKTVAGDVLHVYYNSAHLLQRVEDHVRTFLFSSESFHHLFSDHFYYTGVSTGDMQTTFEYSSDTVASPYPFWGQKEVEQYENVLSNPRRFLTSIVRQVSSTASGSSSISTIFEYNRASSPGPILAKEKNGDDILDRSGSLRTVTNPLGGVTEYSYTLGGNEGIRFLEFLGTDLGTFGFGTRYLCSSLPDACSGGGGTIPLTCGTPENPGTYLLCGDLSETSTWFDVHQPGIGGPDLVDAASREARSSSCSQEIVCWNVPMRSLGSDGQWHLVMPKVCAILNNCTPSQGGCGSPTYKAKDWFVYGVAMVLRAGDKWVYQRNFSTYDDTDMEAINYSHRQVTLTQPDLTTYLYDYGGISTADQDFNDLNGDGSLNEASDLQYYLDYISGRPRTVTMYDRAFTLTSDGNVGSAKKLQETRHIYASETACHQTSDGKYVWKLDLDNRIELEANRRYQNGIAVLDTLHENIYNCTQKSVGATHFFAKTNPQYSLTDASMQVDTWPEWFNVVQAFSARNDTDWVFPRRSATLSWAKGGGQRRTDFFVNARGERIAEIEDAATNPDVFRRYYYDSGHIRRVTYGNGGFDLSDPGYTGCGSVTVPETAITDALAISNMGDTVTVEDDGRTYTSINLPAGPPSSTYTVDYQWNSGFPLSSAWGGGDYHEICRDWNSVSGLPSKDTDPNGIEMDYSWDDIGRLTGTTRSHEGRTTTSNVTWTTDSGAGWTDAHVTDGCGGQSHYLYDGMGRLRESWTRYPKTSTSPSWSIVAQTYDGMGRVHEKTEPFDVASSPSSGVFQNLQGKAKTTYTYDALGRVTSVAGPAGFSQSITYDGLKRTVTTTGIHDGSVQGLTSTTDYYNDPLGRLILVDACEGADAVYAYNVAGQLTEAKVGEGLPTGALEAYLQAGPSAVMPTGPTQTRTFSYDALGRLTSETHPEYGMTEDGGTIHYYSYDPLGNLLSYTDAKGQVFGLYYDYKGRKTGMTLGGAELAHWWYDEATDPEGVVFGKSLGRMTRSLYRNGSGGEVTGTAQEVEERYRYERPFGRLSHKDLRVLNREDLWLVADYADCGLITMEGVRIGTLNNEASFNINSSYLAGMLTARKFTHEIPRGVEGITYAPPLAPSGWDISGPAAPTHVGITFEPQGGESNPSRIQSIGLTWYGMPLWSTGPYAYDGAGDITGIGPLEIGGQQGGRTADAFTYDRLGRLTTASVHHESAANQTFGAAFRYAYDDFGNLTGRSLELASPAGTSEAAMVDARAHFEIRAESASTLETKNQLTSILSGGGLPETLATIQTLQYDANGNMEKILGPDNQADLTLTHDPLNRVAKALIRGSMGDSAETYYYNADGERVARLSKVTNTTLPTAPTGHSSYYLRSGAQVVAEEHFQYKNGEVVSNRRKAHLYMGSNLACTEEWEEAYAPPPDPDVTVANFSLGSKLCPGLYAASIGIKRLPGLSDPVLAPQNGQEFTAAFQLQHMGDDVAGAMVRIARQKHGGNGDGGEGNGEPRDDEDKVVCLYFLRSDLAPDTVFGRYGLNRNGDYGIVEPLVPGAGGDAVFQDLQTEKSYRVTLTIWTEAGADLNLGYNRLQMEESVLVIPKNKPTTHLNQKGHQREAAAGGVEAAFRAVWGAVQEEGLRGYNLVGAGRGGERVVLNGTLLTSPEFEAGEAEVRAKGVDPGSALTVETVVDGGGGVIVIGPLPRIKPILCGGSGGGIGLDPVAPSAPEATQAMSLPGSSGPRALVTWQQGARAASRFQVFRAEMGDLQFCAVSGLIYTQVAETQDLLYLDTTVVGGHRYGYKVKGISEDGALVSAFGRCDVADLTVLQVPAGPRGVIAENLSSGGDPNQRRVRVTWQGEPLEGDFFYVVSRTYEAACSACPAAAAQEMTWVQAPVWEDAGAFDPAHEAPCVGYTVKVIHPAVGDLTPASGCAWSRAGSCAALPAPPSNLQGAYDPLTNEEIFTWSPALDAGAWTEYWFYAGAHVNHAGGTLMNRAAATTYRLDAGMYRQGGTFPFTVIAVDTRTGCRSLPLQGIVYVPPNAGCRPPVPPTGMVATVLQDKVVVSWQGPAGVRYKISKASGRCGTAWSWAGITDATHFTDHPPVNSWASYEVHTVDPVTGCESVVGTGCAEAFMPPPPEPPGGLVADDENYRDARVTWDAVPGASAYKIFAYGNPCENFSSWTLLAETDTPEYLESLPGGTVKNYAVTALFSSGYETGLSNCDDVEIPAASSAMSERGILPTPHFFVWDHLGSTRVALNGDGGIEEFHAYEPFGVELPPIQDFTGNTHKFTGHEYDASTGLYNYHARMMAPNFGRFASPDKIGVIPERILNPQKLNRYGYCSNNPVNYKDENGLIEIRAVNITLAQPVADRQYVYSVNFDTRVHNLSPLVPLGGGAKRLGKALGIFSNALTGEPAKNEKSGVKEVEGPWDKGKFEESVKKELFSIAKSRGVDFQEGGFGDVTLTKDQLPMLQEAVNNVTNQMVENKTITAEQANQVKEAYNIQGIAKEAVQNTLETIDNRVLPDFLENRP